LRLLCTATHSGLADGVGFEPTNPCGLAVFKTAALNRSATHPAQSDQGIITRARRTKSEGRHPAAPRNGAVAATPGEARRRRSRRGSSIAIRALRLKSPCNRARPTKTSARTFPGDSAKVSRPRPPRPGRFTEAASPASRSVATAASPTIHRRASSGWRASSAEAQRRVAGLVATPWLRTRMLLERLAAVLSSGHVYTNSYIRASVGRGSHRRLADAHTANTRHGC
jgi:hypothetical protein